MRRVKPLLLLRADTASAARKGDALSRLAMAGTGAALVLVAAWQSGSLRAGLFVSAGLAAITLVVAGAGWLLLRLTKPLTESRHFAVRHALVSLRRPGNQTRVILTAVGLGCFFVLSIRAVQSNLVSEFTAQVGATSPDLVLIDIQRDQVDGVRSSVRTYEREASGSWVSRVAT
jgi:putative ABC transport system permease protein